jgi:hypothetical protein
LFQEEYLVLKAAARARDGAGKARRAHQ